LAVIYCALGYCDSSGVRNQTQRGVPETLRKERTFNIYGENKMSIYCPYGNMYPTHNPFYIAFTLITFVGIIGIAYLIYLTVNNPKINMKRGILVFIGFLFIIITLLLNLYTLKW
jgi:hypothetical protein